MPVNVKDMQTIPSVILTETIVIKIWEIQVLQYPFRSPFAQMQRQYFMHHSLFVYMDSTLTVIYIKL